MKATSLVAWIRIEEDFGHQYTRLIELFLNGLNELDTLVLNISNFSFGKNNLSVGNVEYGDVRSSLAFHLLRFDSDSHSVLCFCK